MNAQVYKLLNNGMCAEFVIIFELHRKMTIYFKETKELDLHIISLPIFCVYRLV